MSLEHFDGWKKGDPIEYIRKDIPNFDSPGYKGRFYEAMVPDTLDLQHRAALAVNGLTAPTDPDADYEIYWRVNLKYNPPIMEHTGDDHVQVKFMEALPLMRLISGSDLNDNVERRWMEVLLHMQGPDGSLYYPVKGRPWCLGLHTYGGFPKAQHYTRPYDDGRLLGAMSIYYLLTGEKLWADTGKKVVDGLSGRAIDKGDYAYFEKILYDCNSKINKSASMPDGGPASTAGWVLHGLTQFFRTTGYEPACDLAVKLAYGLKDHANWYDPDGRFIMTESGHFHHHTLPLLAITELAILTDDSDLLALAGGGYEFGKTQGAPLVGFFPEAVTKQVPYAEEWKNTSETCQVADMISLGLKLSLAGAGDYWDDVDRWTRNQFAESQLLRYDWIYRMVEHDPPSAVDNRYQTTEKVGQRSVGAFAGWPTANDWFFGPASHGAGITHCCTGNAARTIYYVWKNILQYDSGRLRVNLLLNRASEWADVNSHVPYTGQVDVKIKKTAELEIRIPEWTEPENVKATVNGLVRELTFNARYAKIGPVKAGDEVTLTFPIEERTSITYIEKKRYPVVHKGNDVVFIDPPGRYCPLYQRAHYRENNTRWHKVQRFIPEKEINW